MHERHSLERNKYGPYKEIRSVVTSLTKQKKLINVTAMDKPFENCGGKDSITNGQDTGSTKNIRAFSKCASPLS